MHVFSIPDWIVCLRKSISRYVFLRSLFAIKKVVYFPFSQAYIRRMAKTDGNQVKRNNFQNRSSPQTFFPASTYFLLPSTGTVENKRNDNEKSFRFDDLCLEHTWLG